MPIHIMARNNVQTIEENKKSATDQRQEFINRFVRKMLDLKKAGIDLRTYRPSNTSNTPRPDPFNTPGRKPDGRDNSFNQNMPYRPGWIYDNGHWRRVTRQDKLYQNLAAKGGGDGKDGGKGKKSGTGVGGDGLIASSSVNTDGGGDKAGGPKNPSANLLDNPGGGNGKMKYGRKPDGSPYARGPIPPLDPLTKKADEFHRFMDKADPFSKAHQTERRKWDAYISNLESTDKKAYDYFMKRFQKWGVNQGSKKSKHNSPPNKQPDGKSQTDHLINVVDGLLGAISCGLKMPGPQITHVPVKDDPA